MLSLRSLVCCTAALLCSAVAFAQGPSPRLHSPIRDGARSQLPGSGSPQARFGEDLGPLPGDQRLDNVTLVFKRSAEQQADLDALLEAQADPHSTQYHHWLTPEAFGARFGVAESDLDNLRSWLTAQSFTVGATSPSHDRLSFTGTAAQLRSALGADLHSYSLDGEIHFGPATDLLLPEALASVTAAVLHLSDLRPTAMVRPGPQPAYTDIDTGTRSHFLTPRDLAVMYNLHPVGSPSLDGRGQAMAVVGQSYIDAGSSSPVGRFVSALGQSFNPMPLLVPGTGVEDASPGDQGETELDLEYSAGVAPNATVFLVHVGDSNNYSVFDSLVYAIQQNLAPVISVSYSQCELLLSASVLNSYNSILMQAAAQGQTVVVSSGDSGSTGCARFATGPTLTTAQQAGLAVGFPASSPYVTAVGGTQMAPGTFNSGSGPYWADFNTSGASLLSYVPEVVWNEGSSTRGIVAGGGGASSFYPRPSWQTSFPGLPAGSTRLLPDISLQASTVNPGFLLCTGDPYLQGSQSATCTLGFLGSSSKFTVAGGTSFSAPFFAASLTLLNQAQGSSGQGNINPTLYSLASSPSTYSSVFHDIVSGSIACVPGATGCTAAGQSGFAATPGFDEATGLGSVDLGLLRSAWPSQGSISALEPTRILLQFPSSSQVTSPYQGFSPGSPVTVPLSVISDLAAAQSAPTGSISVSVNGAPPTSLTFPSASASANSSQAYLTFVAPLTPGYTLLRVSYPGDTRHTPSNAVFSLLVGSLTANGTFAVSGTNLTVANGSVGSVPILVTPGAGYHGRVVWSLSATGGSSSTTACYSIASLSVSASATGKLYLGTGAACNAPLTSGGSAATAFTPAPAHPETASLSHPHSPLARVLASLCLGWGLSRRRRLLTRAALLPVLLLTSLGLFGSCLVGCGGSSPPTSTSNPGMTTPTPAAATTYQLTLTGRDSVNSSITSSTTFTFTVK